MVVEYEDSHYADLFEDLSVSTVTVGPNVTEHEVGQMQTREVLSSPNKKAEKFYWYSQPSFRLFNRFLNMKISRVTQSWSMRSMKPTRTTLTLQNGKERRR